MKNEVFDLFELWRRVEGVTDKNVLKEALQELEAAVKGRRMSEYEMSLLVYLRARV